MPIQIKKRIQASIPMNLLLPGQQLEMPHNLAQKKVALSKSIILLSKTSIWD